MVTVSNDFKTAMKQPIKEIQAFIDYDGNSIKDSDDLISLKISCDSGLCKTAMRKLEAKYLGSHNLLGKWVKVGYGVRLLNGTFEYLNFGSFLVTELTVAKDTDTTSVIGYDLMINTMTPYAKLNLEYPLNLINYTRVLCDSCGLELGNVVFGKNVLKGITSYTWVNNSSATHEIIDDYIKVSMPESPNQYSGIYSGAIKAKLPDLLGKKMVYSFYAKADADRTIMFQSAGSSAYVYINLTTEWQRFSYVIDSVEDVAPTFYCGNTLDTTPYYIRDIMLGTDELTEYKAYNAMNDWQITQELWENIEGITYRDIFVQIAQSTASTCIIGADNKVYFKELTDTGESLTYDNMFKLKLEALYGEINSVVLSRTPSEDNIYLQDTESVQTNGLTEFKIENNEIIDKDRESAITPIFDVLNGVCYYPFESTTEGLGWYEIADNITIVNDLGEEFKTSLFNYSITIDGSIKETLKTTAENKTQTQYQYATTLSKRVKNTEIIVNKQEQYIQQLVSDMYEENGVVNEKYTSIYQDIDNIVNSVQNSGGNNLIKNSVMFAYDSNNKPTNWEVEGDGTLVIESNAESLAYGGLSGHSFTLLNKIARQTVTVDNSGTNTYTFSTKIKKNAVGSCYVRIYNDSENYIKEIPEGVSAFYTDYEIKGIIPKENYYIVEFYGSADSNATFTDNMLALGEYKSQWTQANGEVMNTQVNINIDGITVKSSVYLGDYTVISPLEFAGYSIINGTPTKIFSLNKDVTEVEKLKAKAEITMTPIKIVPVTEGDLQGWAFVPSTEEV